MPYIHVLVCTCAVGNAFCNTKNLKKRLEQPDFSKSGFFFNFSVDRSKTKCKEL